MNNFDLLRALEEKLKNSGIIDMVQETVRKEPGLWDQNDEKTCWLTSCKLQVCFNVRKQEDIATAEPFLMLSIGTYNRGYYDMSIHGNREYCLERKEGVTIDEFTRKR